MGPNVSDIRMFHCIADQIKECETIFKMEDTHTVAFYSFFQVRILEEFNLYLLNEIADGRLNLLHVNLMSLMITLCRRSMSEYFQWN